MLTEERAYRDLQKHLNTMPVGFPPTKEGTELDLLRAIFTEEQARVATHLDYKHRTVDEIWETAQGHVASKEELERILDETVSRGGIFRRTRDGRSQYAVIPFVLWGMYEHQIKRLTPEFLADTGAYLLGEFGLEMATHTVPKMRVIPIEESVQAEHQITTYDELRHLIAQAGDQIAIQECVCKKVGDMMDKPCKVTARRETCMSLGDLADLYVEEGWARRLDRAEALGIARQNEVEGLVLMPANEQEPNFICACCSDCCGMLGMIRAFPRPADMVGSNFFARVDGDNCNGCAVCATRCQMQAVELSNGGAAIDLKRCIGCGLCVPACPEGAVSLVRKEAEVVPPRTVEEMLDTILAQKRSFKGRLRNRSLKTLLRLLTRFSGGSSAATQRGA